MSYLSFVEMVTFGLEELVEVVVGSETFGCSFFSSTTFFGS